MHREMMVAALPLRELGVDRGQPCILPGHPGRAAAAVTRVVIRLLEFEITSWTEETKEERGGPEEWRRGICKGRRKVSRRDPEIKRWREAKRQKVRGLEIRDGRIRQPREEKEAPRGRA